MSTSQAVKDDWAALIEADKVGGPLERDEMTAEMYAAGAGKSIGWACSRLKRLYEMGKATRRPYGFHSWAYRLVKGK